MQLSFYEVKKLPVVMIDNFFDPIACEKIWQELCFLHSNLLPPDLTAAAWKIDENGNKIALKSNSGAFLDGVYNDRNFSFILKENRKLFQSDFVEKLIDEHVIFRHIAICNSDTTLINYYENSDYYDYHHDMSRITALSWFYKKPKAFSGGELIFEDDSLTIECLHNRMVIFPSVIKHKVCPVKVSENFIGENYGRYSMAQFINYKGEE